MPKAKMVPTTTEKIRKGKLSLVNSEEDSIFFRRIFCSKRAKGTHYPTPFFIWEMLTITSSVSQSHTYLSLRIHLVFRCVTRMVHNLAEVHDYSPHQRTQQKTALTRIRKSLGRPRSKGSASKIDHQSAKTRMIMTITVLRKEKNQI